MKSNTSVMLFAVYLFGVIVSLNSLPMVPGGGEISSTYDNSSTCIRNYITNILKYKTLSKLSTAELFILEDPNLLEKLDSFKDNSFISDYSKFRFDPEFIARVTEAWDQVRRGLEEGNPVNDKEAHAILLDITKKKINEKKDNNELKTLEYYAVADHELYHPIAFFIEDVKYCV
ncbi:uncharacterized protein LOC126842595 [Adelges cooleyi]|uniref:uncharacterized protein LOC126842595 n=1 Tax=Adelges cooleyi TaxID=133065 RepID=UPI00217F813F|nr:uncharacterized protein LOC126842595 [Adelges cooleyi]